MCLGNNTTTKTEDKTTTIDPRLADQSVQNIQNLSNLANAGYQAYTGPRVADLSAGEQTGNSMVDALAGTQNPYTSLTAAADTANATQGPSTVSTVRATDNVPGANGSTAGGSTQDYMDPYLAQVLTPQLYDIDKQTALQQNQLNAQAAMGGAFGDARSGFQASANTDAGNRLRAGTIGTAYSNAFNNAMGLKEADIGRNLDVQKSNAALNEQALARQLAGGNALTSLDQYNTGRTADLAKLEQQQGATSRGIDQAKLDAAYQEYAKGHLDDSTMLQLLNQAINGSPLQKQGTTDTTTQQPDTSGFGMIGTLGGAAMKYALA